MRLGWPSGNGMVLWVDWLPALNKKGVMPLILMLVQIGITAFHPLIIQGLAEIRFAAAARPAHLRSASDVASRTHTTHPIVMHQVLPVFPSGAPSSPVRDVGSPLIQMEPPLVSSSTWKEVAPKWEPSTMPTAAHSVMPPSMEQLSVLTTELDK